MAFTNTPEFEDDFRKVGPDATAGFAPAGSPSNPTEHASSENLDVAGKKADDADEDEDDDLEDDDDEDDENDENDDEDDLDDEEDEDDEDEDVEDDEDEDEELEDDDSDKVRARLGDAEKRARS